jgi:hypothetical protein
VYKVVLTVDGKDYVQSIRVEPDPAGTTDLIAVGEEIDG